ncbi:recQ-mediated genome instability protein 1 [Ziziphus jujuba]|uniref:RecQ-mediated genome instability protein 1 n=1 Tax=Ziziphus jujuba TaxID=326968 RepID=A0ABM4A1Q3_ZIZJJ|nr:recQ-mediated genome instability protein 1 [Ziziphus jujuba]
MPRRRLRLSTSSDDEENDDVEPQNHHQPQQEDEQPPTITQHHPLNPNPNNRSEPLEISDDEEFIDVSDNLSEPSPPERISNQQPQPQVAPPSSGGGCPITGFLQGLGLTLKREWFDACVLELERSMPGFANLDVGAKAKLVFERFLVSDMNYSGGGGLPENVHSLHLVDLSGPYVLQVDEIVNISSALKSRYQKAPPGIKRCLKLSMTDGVQRVFAMEYRPIKDLDVLAPAGLKVAICNVHVRRGLLMLVPESFEVLGGLVEELDAARQRLVDEVNKPPRGKRTRTGVVPPLITRATLAAWPSTDAHNAHTNNSTSQDTTLYQVHDQGATFVASGGNTERQRTLEEFSVPVSEHYAIPNPSRSTVWDDEETHIDTVPSHRSNGMPNPLRNIVADAEEVHMDTVPSHRSNDMSNSSLNIVSDANEIHMDTVSSHRSNDIPNPLRNIISDAEEIDMDTVPSHRSNGMPYPSRNIISGPEDIHMDTVPTSSRSSGMPNPSTDVASVGEEVEMDAVPYSRPSDVSEPCLNDFPNDEDVSTIEHPLILSGDQEMPFTYLASLSAKWAAMRESAHFVRGKIKCFLTGVKGFQYKRRKTYELRVYVDDGSLISEIIVDHKVVQKGIGHSPEDVTAALSSSDTSVVRAMKETLKQFQFFLVNFEGIILIEINETSPVPVALEMNQGCPESDAWLLLRRLKASAPAQTLRSTPLNPLDISP